MVSINRLVSLLLCSLNWVLYHRGNGRVWYGTIPYHISTIPYQSPTSKCMVWYGDWYGMVPYHTMQHKAITSGARSIQSCQDWYDPDRRAWHDQSFPFPLQERLASELVGTKTKTFSVSPIIKPIPSHLLLKVLEIFLPKLIKLLLCCLKHYAIAVC